jgi:hypothetical protein
VETFFSILHILIGDVTIFVLLQGLVLVLFVYSAMHHKRSRGAVVKKYSLKTSDLVLAYSLISASLIQAVSSVDVLAQFKLGIILTNLVALFYLCFFSPWFQGMIARVASRVGREVKMV